MCPVDSFEVSFLNKSLSANLQARDLLGTSIHEQEPQGLGFYSHNKYYPKSPVIVLTISYRIDNFKTNRRGSQNGDDEF